MNQIRVFKIYPPPCKCTNMFVFDAGSDNIPTIVFMASDKKCIDLIIICLIPVLIKYNGK